MELLEFRLWSGVGAPLECFESMKIFFLGGEGGGSECIWTLRAALSDLFLVCFELFMGLWSPTSFFCGYQPKRCLVSLVPPTKNGLLKQAHAHRHFECQGAS